MTEAPSAAELIAGEIVEPENGTQPEQAKSPKPRYRRTSHDDRDEKRKQRLTDLEHQRWQAEMDIVGFEAQIELFDELGTEEVGESNLQQIRDGLRNAKLRLASADRILDKLRAMEVP